MSTFELSEWGRTEVIDSRDLYEQAEYLDDIISEGDATADERAERDALADIIAEGEDYSPDFQHGETIILESYFPEYVQEMLEDIGDIPRDLPGYICIDWDRTASNVRIDYTDIEHEGVTYLVRMG